MLQPVAGVEEKMAWRKLVTHGDVAVREDEELNVQCLQQLTGELNLVFVFTFED